MGTQMLEGGADIRFIQVMLGHSNLRATEVYTQVSIRKLKEIHTATHPGARLRAGAAQQQAHGEDAQADREQLLEALGAEAQEEEVGAAEEPE